MAIALTKLQHSRIEESSRSRLQAFQRKIYLKAKTNPDYKFYCLYDKVFRKDTIQEAYRLAKANKGSCGIDVITWDDLKGKEQEFIDSIHTELKQKVYKPNALLEVQIPKRNGKTRTLQIPTIRDRVTQTAIKLIIEPIFEADFKESSYGYRPKRGAHDEIRKLSELLFRDIYSKEKKILRTIDLSNCFNTIPHRELMKAIGRRVTDRQLLKLIKSFLQAGAMDEPKGTPQGGAFSPLLANIYLNKIDEYWEQNFHESELFRYADDIVIVLTQKEKTSFQQFLEHIEENLKLIINTDKSHISNTKDGINVLGFTLKEKTSKQNKRYLAKEPSKESMNRIRNRIREVTKWNRNISNEYIIEKTNLILKGWQQYFDNICIGDAIHNINNFVYKRIAKIMSRRNKKKYTVWKWFGGNTLYGQYGLYKMKSLGRRF